MTSPLNSDEFAKGAFKPHGRSEVAVDGKIFRLQTEGPFNIEAIQAINTTRLHLLESKAPTGPYAFVNRWRGSALMSMDALAEYEAGLRAAYINRFRPPVAMAWIIPSDVEGSSMMKPLFERIFRDVGIPYGQFEDADSAEAWVANQMQPK